MQVFYFNMRHGDIDSDTLNFFVSACTSTSALLVNCRDYLKKIDISISSDDRNVTL